MRNNVLAVNNENIGKSGGLTSFNWLFGLRSRYSAATRILQSWPIWLNDLPHCSVERKLQVEQKKFSFTQFQVNKKHSRNFIQKTDKFTKNSEENLKNNCLVHVLYKRICTVILLRIKHYTMSTIILN